jgi:hypothetical protein
LFDDLKPWLTDRLAEISAKSPLAEAIHYTLNQWDGLCVFLTDGGVEVDNNIVERTIRPIALGRRNALFAGWAGGDESWACLASLINTAKLHEIARLQPLATGNQGHVAAARALRRGRRMRQPQCAGRPCRRTAGWAGLSARFSDAALRAARLAPAAVTRLRAISDQVESPDPRICVLKQGPGAWPALLSAPDTLQVIRFAGDFPEDAVSASKVKDPGEQKVAT